jgi:hypothetical protein
MKLITLFTALFAICLSSFVLQAQAPQGLNYQAIARNPQGQPYSGQTVAVQFSILNGSANGTVVYAESHSAQTNAFGLFNLVVGGGTPTQGTFSAINWGNGLKFLKVDIDGALQGTSQFLSVPYAINATYADHTNIQAGPGISVSGNTITNTSLNTDGQTLSVNGNNLAISGGNSITLPSTTYTAGAGIGISGSTVSNTGDLSPTNEIQTLGISGNTLSISGTGGNSVTLPASQWTTSGSNIYYNAGKVLVGVNAPVNSNPTTLLQVGSSTTEAALFLAGKGGSNHSSIALGEFGGDKSWSMVHKGTANNGTNHYFSIEYQDGSSLIDGILKLTPEGNTALGYTYNQVPPASKLSVKGGDINVVDVGKGVIMKSPNGSCWRLTVSNSGQPVFTSVTCP